jgi:hypothetical protein
VGSAAKRENRNDRGQRQRQARFASLVDCFAAELVLFERMAWLLSTEAARAVPPP